jgi:hypothetical protein
VFIDFYYTARILDAGGIVLFDDSVDPHVHKTLRFIRKNLPQAQNLICRRTGAINPKLYIALLARLVNPN